MIEDGVGNLYIAFEQLKEKAEDIGSVDFVNNDMSEKTTTDDNSVNGCGFLS